MVHFLPTISESGFLLKGNKMLTSWCGSNWDPWLNMVVISVIKKNMPSSNLI